MPSCCEQPAGAIRGCRARWARGPNLTFVPDGQVGKQGGVLEDQADAPPLGRQAGEVGPGEADLPGPAAGAARRWSPAALSFLHPMARAPRAPGRPGTCRLTGTG